MSWQNILGHNDQLDMLRRSVERKRLGHTWLFVGPAGVGKKRFAVMLAQCLLCERHTEVELTACGECAACKQVAARTHPDLLMVACPEGKSELPIELFLGPPERRGKAGLCYELSLRPMSGRRKVAIIDDADKFNDEGANALLKTLEEPPPHSLQILIATTPDVLLPTIRSRCQVLRFNPLTEGDVRQLLLQEGLTESAEDAEEVARLCDGSLETAAQLLDPQLREARGTLYDLLAHEQFNTTQLTAKMIEGLQEAGSETSSQRQYASWIVRFCIEFYRRSLLQLAASETNIGHADFPQVSRFAGRFPRGEPEPLERVGNLLERCHTAETQLDSKVAVPLCLEALCDDLGRLSRAG